MKKPFFLFKEFFSENIRLLDQQSMQWHTRLYPGNWFPQYVLFDHMRNFKH